MKLAALVGLTGTLAYFDLQLLVQASNDRREIIRVQLSRWMAQGKVISLRRGMYTLADEYRRAQVTPALLANQLYRPSYLSGLWALGFHDLIPERVVSLTSVTPRGPRRFENHFGVFEYRNVRQDRFFGYQAVRYAGGEIIVAEPEKAILDHWHHTPGEWTLERLHEMRYQHMEVVDNNRLASYAARFTSPRLNRAVGRWVAGAAEEENGTVTL